MSPQEEANLLNHKPVLAGRDIYLDLGGRNILSGVTCEVHAGEVLGILGPNGAGKTSLLEVLSGRYRSQRGEVFLNGLNITGLPIHKRAELGLARTYQTPVIPYALSVYDVLKAARKAFRPHLSQSLSEWVCDLVGLKVPGDLPAGAVKIVAVAAWKMRQGGQQATDQPRLIDDGVEFRRGGRKLQAAAKGLDIVGPQGRELGSGQFGHAGGYLGHIALVFLIKVADHRIFP